MVKVEELKKGRRIVVSASEINHDDDREITLEYDGNGYFHDVDNGNQVGFNTTLFPNVYEGMCISLGLVYNTSVCETYKVVRVL